MSGLLHRLAARATGTAWTVRTDARLPFGAAPAFEGDGVQELVPAAAANAAPRQPTRPAHQTTTSTAEVQQPATAHDTPAAATVPSGTPARPTPAATRPSPAAEPLASHALQQPHALHTTGLPEQPTAPPAMPAMRVTGVDAPYAEPPPRHRTQPLRDEPGLLLPRVRGEAARPLTAASTPATAAHPRPGAATPAAPQDTEVHIHIGRIDVTALHEAPQPKPGARERTQPVSLDAYLAKRGDQR